MSVPASRCRLRCWGSLEDAADMARMHQLTRAQSLDLLQTDHLLSGIDIALWDLLGRRHQTPVHALLGMDKAHLRYPMPRSFLGTLLRKPWKKRVPWPRMVIEP